MTIQTDDGMTALILSLLKPDLAVFKLLLENGASVDEQTAHGETALFFACGLGHLEIVKMLLDKGADVTIATNYGETPLSAAEQGGHRKIAELIRQNSAQHESGRHNQQPAPTFYSNQRSSPALFAVNDSGASTVTSSNPIKKPGPKLGG